MKSNEINHEQNNIVWDVGENITLICTKTFGLFLSTGYIKLDFIHQLWLILRHLDMEIPAFNVCLIVLFVLIC